MKIVLSVTIPWQKSPDKGEYSCCLPHGVIGLRSLFLTLILFLVTFHKNLDMQT